MKKRRWWEAKSGKPCTTVRIDIHLSRRDLEFLEQVAAKEGESLSTVLRGCFWEGFTDLDARQPLHNEVDTDEP